MPALIPILSRISAFAENDFLTLFGDHFAGTFAPDLIFEAGKDLIVFRIGIEKAKPSIIASLGHFGSLSFEVNEEFFGPFVFFGLIEDLCIIESDLRVFGRVALDGQNKIILGG